MIRRAALILLLAIGIVMILDAATDPNSPPSGAEGLDDVSAGQVLATMR